MLEKKRILIIQNDENPSRECKHIKDERNEGKTLEKDE